MRGSWRANGRGSQPRPRLAKPKCPTWLDAEAKSKWRQLVRDLSELGLLTAVDGDTLAAYCTAWSELRTATETLQREGRTFVTENGYKVPHPAVAQQRSAWQAVRAFAALFGLDPADRSRLQVPAGCDDVDTTVSTFARKRSS
jgi:P27 family predicted phage terminase small subunit